MSSMRRLQKELSEIQAASLKTFKNIQLPAPDGNLLQWQGSLYPVVKVFWKREIFYRSKEFSLHAGKPKLADYAQCKENPPYNKGAFRIQIDFPAEYPFKPPKLTFITKIYHPNVDEKGQVCLPIISPENWKPATKTEQVIGALIALVNEPEPEHPLRGDLAEEFTKEPKKFMKNAEDFTKKFADKRTD